MRDRLGETGFLVAVVRVTAIAFLAIAAYGLSTRSSGSTLRAQDMAWIVVAAFAIGAWLVGWYWRFPHESRVRLVEPPLDVSLVVASIFMSAAAQGELHVLTKSPGQLLLVATVLIASLRGSVAFTVYGAVCALVGYAMLYGITEWLAHPLVHPFGEPGDLAGAWVGPSRVTETAIFIALLGALAVLNVVRSQDIRRHRAALRSPELREIAERMRWGDLSPVEAVSDAFRLMEADLRHAVGQSPKEKFALREIVELLFTKEGGMSDLGPFNSEAEHARRLFQSVWALWRNPIQHGLVPEISSAEATSVLLLLDSLHGFVRPSAARTPQSMRRMQRSAPQDD